ncbi:hypothetical protein [Devosia beringensis]|uniref:hypothetical protein n=1 Tax=Devosia beringensis TaxID=2657486 RepID=UPI00186BAC03|nr:hypothetical protein [Devosia beringensis]
MNDVNYADRRFSSRAPRLTLHLSCSVPLSYSDLAEVLKDVESIYKVSAQEVVARLTSRPSSKPDVRLLASEFRSGSLEIFTDPIFTGVVSGVAANVIYGVFIHVMQRIKGRAPSENGNGPALDEEANIISSEKLKTAKAKSMEKTNAPRRRLKEKSRTHELHIRITYREKTIEVLD